MQPFTASELNAIRERALGLHKAFDASARERATRGDRVSPIDPIVFILDWRRASPDNPNGSFTAADFACLVRELGGHLLTDTAFRFSTPPGLGKLEQIEQALKVALLCARVAGGTSKPFIGWFATQEGKNALEDPHATPDQLSDAVTSKVLGSTEPPQIREPRLSP